MEVSNRTLVRKKLASLYELKVGKDALYKMICGYNDSVLKTKNFNSAVEYLATCDSLKFYEFYGYVYDVMYLVEVE